MAYIYKITNTINGKAYVGQTIYSLEKRFTDHVSDSTRSSHRKRPLYKAMLKYGKSAFTIEVIEELPADAELLNCREIYWIAKLHTFCKDPLGPGYNATLGGGSKMLYDRQAVIEYLHTNNCVKDAAIAFNCTKDTIIDIAKAADITVKASTELVKELYSKPINIYDLQNNLVHTVGSVRSAAQWIRDNNISSAKGGAIRAHISEVCRGKRKTAYGFVWKFVDK